MFPYPGADGEVSQRVPQGGNSNRCPWKRADHHKGGAEAKEIPGCATKATQAAREVMLWMMPSLNLLHLSRI